MKNPISTTVLTAAFAFSALSLMGSQSLARGAAEGTTSSGGGANVCFFNNIGTHTVDADVHGPNQWDPSGNAPVQITNIHPFQQVDLYANAHFLKRTINQVLGVLDNSGLSRHIRKTVFELKPFIVDKPFKSPLNADFRGAKTCSPANTRAVFYYVGDGLYLSKPLWQKMTFSAQVEALIHEAIRVTQIQIETAFPPEFWVTDDTVQIATSRIFQAYVNKTKVSLQDLFRLPQPQETMKLAQLSTKANDANTRQLLQDVTTYFQSISAFDYDLDIRSGAYQLRARAVSLKSSTSDIDGLSRLTNHLSDIIVAISDINAFDGRAAKFQTFLSIPGRISLQASQETLRLCYNYPDARVKADCKDAVFKRHEENVAQIVEK